jgi:NADH dehydrogenase FAD-containing subunit
MVHFPDRNSYFYDTGVMVLPLHNINKNNRYKKNRSIVHRTIERSVPKMILKLIALGSENRFFLLYVFGIRGLVKWYIRRTIKWYIFLTVSHIFMTLDVKTTIAIIQF